MRIDDATARVESASVPGRRAPHAAVTARRAARAAVLLGAGFLLLVFAAACGGSDSGAPAVAVRDSARVRIVTSSAPAWSGGGGWRLSADPVLDIGTLEGPPETQLFEVSDVLRLSDGRIVVANNGSQELRVFDRDGAWLASAGGEGEGPGEFVVLSDLDATAGDSIWAWDWRLRRHSLFDPSAALVRTVDVAAGLEGTVPSYLGRFADGALLLRLWNPRRSSTGDRSVRRVDEAYVRLVSGTGGVDTLAVLPSASSWVRTGANVVSFSTIPYTTRGMAAIEGTDLWTGTGATCEATRRDRSANTVELLRWNRDVVPVTGTLWDARKRRSLEFAADDPAERKRIEEDYADMPRPDHVPCFFQLQVDASGDVWARRYPLPDDPPGATWDVFDPDGRWLGPVTLPEELQVAQIGDDFVLGTADDELGVEHVRMYALVKPETGARD